MRITGAQSFLLTTPVGGEIADSMQSVTNLEIVGLTVDTDAGLTGTGYTINRFGDTSMMTGGNAQAGGSWPQNPTTFGDTTFHNDRASSGNSWNATDQRLEDSRHIFSRDRQGNSSSRICGLLDRC